MNRLDQRMEEIRLWEEWKMGDYQRAQPEEKTMTITIELLNTAGDKTVKVQGMQSNASEPTDEGEVAPGAKRIFHLWAGKNLILSEKGDKSE